MEYLSRSLEDTAGFAQTLLAQALPQTKACVITLTGELGSGKTALVKLCAKTLGVTEEITSPTFVIFKKYSLTKSSFKTLVHVDAYRLENTKELERLHFKEELANPDNLIVIEWAERVTDLVPVDALRVNCEYVDETTRKYYL
jgi:tRNA threonylcarbamoyladenosine biosynthesis protein TsaE